MDPGHAHRGLGPDGPKRPESDRQIANPRGVALDDVKQRPLAGEEVANDRCRQQCPAGQRQLICAAGRGEDTEVHLCRSLGRVGRAPHDRDFVDDDIAAAKRRTEAVRADGEDRDEDGHRHPRPLAPVEPPQDEIVDRADQDDVAEQQKEQTAERWEGEDGQLGDGADDLAVVTGADQPRRPRRDEPPPEANGRLRLRDPADRRVDAENRDGTAAVAGVGRDDSVT